jgi:hypothetical protein
LPSTSHLCTLDSRRSRRDSGSRCSLTIDAGHTAFIGVVGRVILENGYACLGFTAGAVPEPATVGLLIGGLTAVGAVTRGWRP